MNMGVELFQIGRIVGSHPQSRITVKMKSTFLSIVFGLIVLGTSGCLESKIETAQTSAPPPLRSASYAHAAWINGWRKNPSDKSTPVLAIETSQYRFTLTPSDFSQAGFEPVNSPAASYAASLATGLEPMKKLARASVVIELEQGGKIYWATTCKAGSGTDSGRLGYARMWEAGRFVQHFDFLDLKFQDADKNPLPCQGTLDLVAWPNSLTFSATLAPDEKSGPAFWADAKFRLRLQGGGRDCHQEKSFPGNWVAGEPKTLTLTYSLPGNSVRNDEILIRADAGKNQVIPVAFVPGKNCFVATAAKLRRSFKTGYTDIRDYDDFALTVENRSNEVREVPFLLDLEDPANITGLCPILCDRDGRPTGIPVQLSKNWHHGAYLMAYTSLPARPGTNEYRLRVAYGFYGQLPSASHSQLSIVGYGNGHGNGRWDQLAIGCWGETITFDMDMSLTKVAICDVRLLMARAGLNGKSWGWTDAGWGGDWLGLNNGAGEKLVFNDMKTAYLAQGPCLTDVRYQGFYGDHHEVALAAQVQTLRTDDHTRTFQNLKYTFNAPVKTTDGWLYKMGGTFPGYLTPQIAYGHRDGLQAESKVPATLAPKERFVNQVDLAGNGPWWVAFPGAHFTKETMSSGYRALVIRSYQAVIGGKKFSRPTITMPVNHVQKGVGLDLDLLLVPPPGVEQLQPGDTVEMQVEWITLPRLADDYYGPNETFRKHLTENPSSWKTTYREASGNDLKVSAKGGTVLKSYPIRVRAEAATIQVIVQGGVGFVPITFTGLKSVKDLALFEIVDGREIKLDQSVHGNDFWQTDYDEGDQTYQLTYNLPLDNKPKSKWVLK